MSNNENELIKKVIDRIYYKVSKFLDEDTLSYVFDDLYEEYGVKSEE